MGQTFTFDAFPSAALAQLQWEDGTAKRKAFNAADSPLRSLEEYLAQYVPSYDTDGDLAISGNVWLTQAGTSIASRETGGRVALEYDSVAFFGFPLYGMSMYTGDANEAAPAGFRSGLFVTTLITLFASPTYTGSTGTAPFFYFGQNATTGLMAFVTDTLTFTSNTSSVFNGGGTYTFTASTFTIDASGDIDLDAAGDVRIKTGDLLWGTSDDGLTAVTGDFGSVQTVGSGAGGWEGYSINGHTAFVSSGSSGLFGIYDDQNDEWAAQFARNGYARLYYNGSSKLETLTGGVVVTGDMEADTITGPGGEIETEWTTDTGAFLYQNQERDATKSMKYRQTGKKVEFFGEFIVTETGSAHALQIRGLPVTMADAGEVDGNAIRIGSGVHIPYVIGENTTTRVYIIPQGDIAANAPALVIGETVRVWITYEAA